MTREEAVKLFGEDIVSQMLSEAESMGLELVDNLDEVAAYAAERAEHLSLAIGEPGFELALLAERDNLTLKATTDAVAHADALDARLLAVARGALALAARGLRIATGIPPVA